MDEEKLIKREREIVDALNEAGVNCSPYTCAVMVILAATQMRANDNISLKDFLELAEKAWKSSNPEETEDYAPKKKEPEKVH